MKYIIVGDVHGCFYTLQELLNKHWDSSKEKLVLLGDFVNKGKHTFAVIEFLINLEKSVGNQSIILKGNNEYLFEEYYRDSISIEAKQKFENYNLNYPETLDWINQLPHYWQNDAIYASHAGIAKDSEFPIDENDLRVLFNRKPLKYIGKRQFLGHTVVEKPVFDENADAWYLDTGAGFGKKLTAAKVNQEGKVVKIISIEVNKKDISN